MTNALYQVAYSTNDTLQGLSSQKQQKQVLNWIAEIQAQKLLSSSPYLHRCGAHHYFDPDPKAASVYILLDPRVSGLAVKIVRVPRTLACALAHFLRNSPLPQLGEPLAVPTYTHGLILNAMVAKDTIYEIYYDITESLERNPRYLDLLNITIKHALNLLTINEKLTRSPSLCHVLYTLSALLIRKLDASDLRYTSMQRSYSQQIQQGYALLQGLLHPILNTLRDLSTCFVEFNELSLYLSKENPRIFKCHIQCSKRADAIKFIQSQNALLTSLIELLTALQKERLEEHGLSSFFLDLSMLCPLGNNGAMNGITSSLECVLKSHINMLPDQQKPHYQSFYKITEQWAPAPNFEEGDRILQALETIACAGARLDAIAVELWSCPSMEILWLQEHHAEVLSLILLQSMAHKQLYQAIHTHLFQQKRLIYKDSLINVQSILKELDFQLHFLEFLSLSPGHPCQPLLDHLHLSLQDQFTFEVLFSSYSVAQFKSDINKLQQQHEFIQTICNDATITSKEICRLIASWSPLFTVLSWYPKLYVKETWLEALQQCSPEQLQEFHDQKEHTLLQVVENLYKLIELISTLAFLDPLDIPAFSDIFFFSLPQSEPEYCLPSPPPESSCLEERLESINDALQSPKTSPPPESSCLEEKSESTSLLSDFELQEPVSPHTQSSHHTSSSKNCVPPSSNLQATSMKQAPSTLEDIHKAFKRLTSGKNGVKPGDVDKTWRELGGTEESATNHRFIIIPLDGGEEFRMVLPDHKNQDVRKGTLLGAIKQGQEGLEQAREREQRGSLPKCSSSSVVSKPNDPPHTTHTKGRTKKR